jgi:hypothetical protein
MTHQERVAESQKANVTVRLNMAFLAIKKEIIASYDPQTCRYCYPYNSGKLSEAEILRRAQVDKNTIKRDYHSESRTELRQLVTWAFKKCADPSKTQSGKTTGRSVLKDAIREREDIAQRYGLIEFRLSDNQVQLADALRREDRHLERIGELEKQIASYIEILVSLDPTLIKFPGRKLNARSRRGSA